MINFSKIFDNFLHSCKTVISFGNIDLIEFHIWFAQFLHNSRSIGVIQINNGYFSAIIYKSSNECRTNTSTATSYNCNLLSRLFWKYVYFSTVGKIYTPIFSLPMSRFVSLDRSQTNEMSGKVKSTLLTCFLNLYYLIPFEFAAKSRLVNSNIMG